MKNALIFIAGAAVGAVASYFITKGKLNKDHETEIMDIREMYDERVEKIQHASDAIKTLHEKKAEIMHEMEEKAKENGELHENYDTEQVDYTSFSAKKNVTKKENLNPIRVITEQEAEKFSKEYELIGLSLYDDDVLIDDESENIIEDYEPWVGVKSLSTLRTNGDESIYILNEEREAIYDITVVDERFGDVDELVTIE